VAEGNQVAARLTYTGTHRGPIWASRRPTGASSMPALRSSGSAMDGDIAAVRAQLAGTDWWEIQGPQSVP
jgi:predicted ester cyclase